MITLTGLSADKIAELLKKEAMPKPGGGGRKAKDPTEPRTYQTWFALHHVFGFCENPDCSDERPPIHESVYVENLKTHEMLPEPSTGNKMVASVKDRFMCRICFLVGWLSEEKKL